MTFKYTASYYDKLISFMNNVNSNINWTIALKDIITLPIDKFVSRMKSYLWTDKDIVADEVDPIVKNTYSYYTKWFYKLFDLLTDESCGIVVVSGSDNEEISDSVLNKVKIKVNVLSSLLSFNQLDYVVFNGENLNDVQHYATNYKRILLFPVTTIAYHEPNSILSSIEKSCGCKVDIIDDGYYNIFNTPQEIEFNLLRLLIIELVNNPAAHTEEILKNKYGMLRVEPSNLITLSCEL